MYILTVVCNADVFVLPPVLNSIIYQSALLQLRSETVCSMSLRRTSQPRSFMVTNVSQQTAFQHFRCCITSSLTEVILYVIISNYNHITMILGASLCCSLLYICCEEDFKEYISTSLPVLELQFINSATKQQV